MTRNYYNDETPALNGNENGRKRAVKKARVRVPSIEEIEASREAREETLESLRFEREVAREDREDAREARKEAREEAREDRADKRLDKLFEALQSLTPLMGAFVEQSLNHKVEMDQLEIYSELISLRRKAKSVDDVENVIDEGEEDLKKVKLAAEKVKTARSRRK